MGNESLLDGAEQVEVDPRLRQTRLVRSTCEERVVILNGVVFPEADGTDFVAAVLGVVQSQVAAARTWVRHSLRLPWHTAERNPLPAEAWSAGTFRSHVDNPRDLTPDNRSACAPPSHRHCVRSSKGEGPVEDPAAGGRVGSDRGGDPIRPPRCGAGRPDHRRGSSYCGRICRPDFRGDESSMDQRISSSSRAKLRCV